MIKSSLIISTYNWPEALELVLKSVNHQTQLPDEVIIADDGSKDDTRNLIELLEKDFQIPLKHVWQEDKGNRKSKIMNKAIAVSSYDYIISIDGDVILNENFIKDHLMMVEENVYLYGSRVNIQKSELDRLFNTKNIKFNFFSKGIKKRGRTLRILFLSKFQKKHSNFSSKMRGCNFSFWKNDFIKVNGYNEDIMGWGREDSELVLRMKNAGVEAKRLKFCAIVYHIYHNEQSKSFLEKNNQIQEKTINNKVIYTENGLNKKKDG